MKVLYLKMLSKKYLKRHLNKREYKIMYIDVGVAPTFPTKPPLRHKMDIKRGFCLR